MTRMKAYRAGFNKSSTAFPPKPVHLQASKVPRPLLPVHRPSACLVTPTRGASQKAEAAVTPPPWPSLIPARSRCFSSRPSITQSRHRRHTTIEHHGSGTRPVFAIKFAQNGRLCYLVCTPDWAFHLYTKRRADSDVIACTLGRKAAKSRAGA